MSKFVQGVQSLFTGPKVDQGQIDLQNQQIAQQHEQQSLALAKQQQDLQAQEDQQGSQAARASRVPRGRRLLLAATGEGGLSGKLG